MAIFDIILATIFIITFIRGVKGGLFKEIASLVGLIIGIYGAINFSYIVGNYLKKAFSWEERHVSLLAFAATFIIIVIAINFAEKLLTKIANWAFLGWLNKIAGGIFGTLKWALIISVVLLLFEQINSKITLISEEYKNQSVLYKPVQSLAPIVFPSVLKPSKDYDTQPLFKKIIL